MHYNYNAYACAVNKGWVKAKGQTGLSKGILRKKNTSGETNPPGVSLNRLDLKKQMRYFFRAKIFCVLQKKCFGENFSLSGRDTRRPNPNLGKKRSTDQPIRPPILM
jgi:hypothetical protein